MFQKTYLLLFHRVTDATEAIEHGDSVQAKTRLIQALQEAEDIYRRNGGMRKTDEA